VHIGVEKKEWVRLVMIPVPPKQRAERVRKAKEDRDKRLNHSKQYDQWIGYGIYIISVTKEVWSSKQVLQGYRV
jgi:hypothetical protein